MIKKIIILYSFIAALLFSALVSYAQPTIIFTPKKDAKGAYSFSDGYKNSVDEHYVKFTISSSQIVIKKTESRICQIKDWDSKGTPRKPRNPFNDVTKGTFSQSANIVIDDEVIEASITVNKSISEKHMKDPLSGTRASHRYGSHTYYTYRAEDIYAPWKYSLSSSYTYNLSNLAKSKEIPIRKLIVMLISANNIIFDGYSSDILYEPYRNCIQKCLKDIYKIKESEIEDVTKEKIVRNNERTKAEIELKKAEEARVAEELAQERTEIEKNNLGWQTLTNDFPKNLKIKRVRVKKRNKTSQYCCVFFSRIPNGEKDSKYFAVNLYTGGILDYANNENWLNGAIERKDQIELEDNWYEYVFSNYVYLYEIQKKANPELIKVYIE